VVERGRQARLAQESLPEARIPGQLGSDQLHRHFALQAQIGGQVDDAHPAPAQHRLQPIPGQIRAHEPIGLDAHRLSTAAVTKSALMRA
jgi:hypothetical protein